MSTYICAGKMAAKESEVVAEAFEDDDDYHFITDLILIFTGEGNKAGKGMGKKGRKTRLVPGKKKALQQEQFTCCMHA